ncbi:Hypothetical protein A7982_04516 [Minicystis rosea]|nr:Hypothetical protein A7982_04516 [Minicystis rosea]
MQREAIGGAPNAELDWCRRDPSAVPFRHPGQGGFASDIAT